MSLLIVWLGGVLLHVGLIPAEVCSDSGAALVESFRDQIHVEADASPTITFACLPQGAASAALWEAAAIPEEDEPHG